MDLDDSINRQQAEAGKMASACFLVSEMSDFGTKCCRVLSSGIEFSVLENNKQVQEVSNLFHLDIYSTKLLKLFGLTKKRVRMVG
ncbi:hypothetical protein [Faecalibaculum rodentium]|uniref:Uncharacterized protein n=1 Tax=Faecalibaculum rodentium TaxID=1702221 RepID=A0A1Q9YMF6_9FIRM|nr:hypothetical protein [Faecalibaculum rodentium]OLU46340.1 hypothetical protein BO223_02470 [Faecalibaculum rodentium]